MKPRARNLGEYVALLVIWVAMIGLFGMLSDNFLTARTFNTLANRIPSLAVVAAGMTLVLVVGGIDLSVGSVLGLCGAVLGVAMQSWQWPLWGGALLAVGVGLLVGTFNGLVSVRFNIPSFIVTLGMLEAARGLAYLVTNSQTKYIGAPVEGISKALPGIGISLAFLAAICVVAVCQILLTRTVWGRYITAIGTNESAVRLAGIQPDNTKTLVFSFIGLLTGVAAVFHTSRLGSADPNAGVGFELSAIAAVVIGGTSLMGGRGSVINSFIGVLIIATLDAGLAQIGASEPKKRVITGVVIVAAVILDAWRHRGKRRGAGG